MTRIGRPQLPVTPESMDAWRRLRVLVGRHGLRPLARALGVTETVLTSALRMKGRSPSAVASISEWEVRASQVQIADGRAICKSLDAVEGERWREKLRILMAICDTDLLAEELGYARCLARCLKSVRFSAQLAATLRTFEDKYGHVAEGFVPPAELRKVPPGTRKPEAQLMREEAARAELLHSRVDVLDVGVFTGDSRSFGVLKRAAPKSSTIASAGPRKSRRNARVYDVGGGRMLTVMDISREFGIEYRTVAARARAGKRGEDLTLPGDARLKTVWTIGGETRTIVEWASIVGVDDATLRLRYSNGLRGEALLAGRHCGPRKRRGPTAD